MKKILKTAFIISIFVGCTKETYIEGLLPQDTTGGQTSSNETTIVNTRVFKNIWKGTYLASNNTSILLSTSSFSWQIEKVNATGNFLIVSKSSSSSLKYLSYAGGKFSLVSNINLSSSWRLVSVTAGNSNEVRIIHLETGGYLHTETGSLSCGPALSGWTSAMWTN
jgi:hypothetical protein